MPLWFGIATIAREVLVSIMVLVLAALGAARIDVLWVGKAGTFGLMYSYPAFLLAYGTAGGRARCVWWRGSPGWRADPGLDRRGELRGARPYGVPGRAGGPAEPPTGSAV